MKSMKFLLVVSLLFVCGTIFSQGIYTPVNATNWGDHDRRHQSDSTDLYPTGCGTPSLNSWNTNLQTHTDKKMSTFWFDSCGHKLWVYDPKRSAWDTAHLGVSSGGGSGSLSGGNLGIGSVKRYVSASSGIKTDSAGPLIVFDTLTTNVVITKVDTSKISKVDTSRGIHLEATLWDGGMNFHTGPVGGGFESVLNFAIGDSPSPATTGDSILYNTAFSNKSLYIFRERDFLHPGVDWSLSHDTITFHPAFLSGERITVYTSSSTPSTISLEGPRYSDLTFTTVSNISQTSHVWTSSTSAWNGHGLDSHTLTSDGSFRAIYSASDGTDFILGWNTSNTDDDYNGYEYGVSLNSGGTINKIVSGVSTSLGVTLSIGNYLRLNRVGSTIKIQTSTDGSTWTDRYTFLATTSATLYFNLNVFTSGKCYNPMYL